MTSARGRSVSTCAIRRTTRGIDPSISSSRAHTRGTSENPSCRAAYAGNSLTRSLVAVKMIEIGLHTPPFGLNAFMISGVVKKAKVEAVFRGVVPFIIAEMTVVLIIIVFPEVVTWLPSKAS